MYFVLRSRAKYTEPRKKRVRAQKRRGEARSTLTDTASGANMFLTKLPTAEGLANLKILERPLLAPG